MIPAWVWNVVIGACVYWIAYRQGHRNGRRYEQRIMNRIAFNAGRGAP